MKKVFTLIILFFCLKLTAFANGIDTPKTLSSNHPDTIKATAAPKPADSIKSKVTSAQKDSIKQEATPLKKDSAGSSVIANLPDSVKAKTTALTRGNSTISGTADYADSLKQVTTIIKKDSLIISAVVNHPDGVAAIGAVLEKENAGMASSPDPLDNLPRITSLIQLDSLKATVIAEQVHQARLRRQLVIDEQIKLAWILKINNLDSLKQQLKTTTIDTAKALLCSRIALKYLDYDTISNPKKQFYYQNQAINYTLQALRQYSIFNDSTGLRTSFDNLAKVYASQRKYSQAKWFILQSNTMSRAKNDTPNIISSLLTLAAVKSDIKDYDLAMRDLDEALQLAIITHAPKSQLQILTNYAYLYSKLQNYQKEALVLKKRDLLVDSMQKSDEALIAKVETQKKKLDSLQNKKKVFSSNTRKLYKSNSKKIDSL